MDAQESSLEDFGYQFLGPICTSYFFSLKDFMKPKQNSCLLFLAREGCFFQKAYHHLCEQNLLPAIDNHYLLASRTFLFRMCIDYPESWDMSLGHGFTGTYRKLFVARFGFSPNDVSDTFSDDILDQSLTLPADIDEAKALLALHRPELKAIISASRSAYFDYLKQFKLDQYEHLVMLDVGYSGTIQKLLTLLLKRNTSGVYFITTEQGQHAVKDHVADMTPVFKNGVKMGEGYKMLDRSLFLEALLTSPDGQFIDIQRTSIADSYTVPFRFFYGRRSYAQEHFLELNAVFKGAIQAISDNFKANAVFSIEEVEQLFELYTASRVMIPSAMWPLFDVDDAISGNANVNPMHLFGI